MAKKLESKLGGQKPQGKKAINQHEEEIARKLGGVRQPNSGALAHRKGDVSVEGPSIMSEDRFLFESKETGGTTLILSVSDVTKICREALEVNKEPALALSFGRHPQIVPREWVAVSLECFASMLARLQEK